MVRGLVFGLVRQQGRMPEETVSCYRNISKLILAFPIATKYSLREKPYDEDAELLSLLPRHLHESDNVGGNKYIAHEVLLALQSYVVYCEEHGLLDR